MTLPDDTREYTPGHQFREGDETTQYWIRGKQILYRHYPLSNVHMPSFRFYLGSFAKDYKNCYCTSSRFNGGNGPTFRALNFCYATDGRFVWTMGGKIKDADAESFVVCDDGVHFLTGGGRVPYGFGKDENRVYYYDYDGKPNWVRKATAKTFHSINDGYFAKDDNFVFCGAAALPKARVEQWEKVGGYYSRDDRRVFYFNREIAAVDYDTFEVVPSGRDYLQLAKDKINFYWNDNVVDAAKFEQMLADH